MFRKLGAVPLIGILATLIVTSISEAQAPVITPAGDPSINADTIYKLAVNPADYPTDDYVLLLDDGVVTVEADGRTRSTYRYIAHVLTQDGAEQWGERAFSYATERQKLTVNWARVVRPNGTIVSDKPSYEQETEESASMYSPVYTKTKSQRMTLAGVEPGTIVDVSYTIEEFKPVMKGAFWTSWSITTGSFTRRSRYVLDAPKDLQLKIVEKNISKPKLVKDVGDRRTYTWAANDVAEVEPEPFMSDSNNTLFSYVRVASPMTWGQIATWYDSLSKDRYAMTPEVKAKVTTVVANAKTLEDSVRAVHRWIAQDLRYVSLSFGSGGHQPRYPAAVVETQYGDCKDKATLFVTIMRDWGIEAEPLLVSADGGVDRNTPHPYAFDHMIAVMNWKGKETFVDLTQALTPFGEIPFPMQNSYALEILKDGAWKGITIPRVPPDSNALLLSIAGTLLPDGTFNGKFVQAGMGALQYPLRSKFSSPIEKDDLENMTRGMASSLFEGGSGDSLVIFNGKDLSATPRISVNVNGAKAVTEAGDSYIMNLPIGPHFTMAAVKQLEAEKPRKTWIDVKAISGYASIAQEFNVMLPAGWTATLPKPVVVKSNFGNYEAKFIQNGQQLSISRKFTGADGVMPPTAMPDVLNWMKQIAADDTKFIVLKAPAKQ